MDKNNPNNLTKEQLQAGYSTIPGAYDPVTGKLKTSLNTTPASVSNVITPDSLAPQPKLTLPTTPVPTEAPKQTPIDYDAMFGLTDFQKQAEQTQETGISEIIKNMGLLQNEATDLQAERQRRGLEDLYKQGQATKSRITALDAEMQQDDIILAQKMRNEERRDTLLPFAQMGQAKLAGDAAIYRGLKTAEKNTLISQQLAQQGEIALAEQFAKDAIDAKYAPYKQNIENYKTILEIIKPSLTAAENKRLKAQEAKVTSAENEIKKAEAEEKSIKELAIKIGSFGADSATIQRVMNAKDFNEAITASGKYLQNPKDSLDMQLTKAQIAKAWADAKKVDTTTGTLTEAQLKQIDTSPQGKKLVSLSGLYQKSQTYKNLLDTYGFQAVGSEKAKLDQAYADLKIAYKEAANLGALTGPDVLLLEEAIKPASGATNYLNYKLSGGKKGVSGAIDGALSKARAEALQNFKQLTARKPEYRGSEYVTSLITPFATDYSKADIDNMGAGEIIQTEDGILLESLGNGQFTPL